jgi:hypothetical protein
MASVDSLQAKRDDSAEPAAIARVTSEPARAGFVVETARQPGVEVAVSAMSASHTE